MREYNPELFRDHDESLIEIERLTQSFDNKVFNVGIHYINKMTGRIKNDRFYKIRDSISIRLNSLIFHYKVLNSIHNPSNKVETRELFPWVTDLIPINQKYLFDSIIFNAISMFDYLACMINLVIERNKDKWERTWTSLENSARNKNPLKASRLGQKIVEVNKDWVNNLNEYRSELIHYQTENLGAKQSYDVLNGQLDILVLAPQQLKKFFKQLKNIPEKQDYNINSITLWIIKTCQEITLEILEELDLFIDENRTIPDDQAVYLIIKSK